jgi:hypothetical protein
MAPQGAIPSESLGESPNDTLAPVRDRLTTTLFLAALFHGIVILGVTFAAPKTPSLSNFHVRSFY